VYVNGQKAGESHDWRAQPSFIITKFLHPGANSIAVSVRNREGPGGVNKGAWLEIRQQTVPPRWQRSVFNGLAQLILQASKENGALTLKVTSPGLDPAAVTITCRQAEARPAVP
jgi:beta-galactosidase